MMFEVLASNFRSSDFFCPQFFDQTSRVPTLRVSMDLSDFRSSDFRRFVYCAQLPKFQPPLPMGGMAALAVEWPHMLLSREVGVTRETI